MSTRIAIIGAAVVAVPLLGVAAVLPGAWRTPEQQGLRRLERGEYIEAAALFTEPFRSGVAMYRAGEFDAAASLFAAVDSPEGAFNRGNALVFLGKYDDAIKSYDRALKLQPGWEEAQQNREIAAARRLESQTGEGTGGKLGADDIVFDNNKDGSPSEEVEVTEGEPTGGEELSALWLRNVQATPADFLRLKFAYQFTVGTEEGEEP